MTQAKWSNGRGVPLPKVFMNMLNMAFWCSSRGEFLDRFTFWYLHAFGFESGFRGLLVHRNITFVGANCIRSPMIQIHFPICGTMALVAVRSFISSGFNVTIALNYLVLNHGFKGLLGFHGFVDSRCFASSPRQVPMIPLS
jgi:hypothetical protein